MLVSLVGCADDSADPAHGLGLTFTSPYDVSGIHLPIRHTLTAVGGTQVITLVGSMGTFNEPYTAVIAHGDSLVVDHQAGAEVTLRGVAPGPSRLSVLAEDGSVIDSERFDAAEIVTVGPLPWAFLPGEHWLPISLNEGAVVDVSMQLSLAGAVREGDGLHVANATVGTYPISVTAGSRPWSLDFVVVDHADAISTSGWLPSAPAPTAVQPNVGATMCFDARAGQRSIFGVAWTLSAMGSVSEVSAGGHCIYVKTDQTSGTITFDASGAGQTASISLPVVP